MLSRLLEAHETILDPRPDNAARLAGQGDDGSNDLLASDIIRTGELQAWFLAEHLVDTPLDDGARRRCGHLDRPGPGHAC
jgi:starvation-inducible DNA-binding protein